MKKINLYEENESRYFYESRYLKWYMEDWPQEKKERIIELIEMLKFKESGEILDFWCWNGIFSNLLKSRLPNWTVYGCDISETAIKNASQRFPECIFFLANDQKYVGKKFDFLFTHHVLEHVPDIEKTAEEIDTRLQLKSAMLHILPCGNSGSYEYNICKLRPDGIDAKAGNRFFWEEKGHIRRLKSNECSNLFQNYWFKLKKDFYANQNYGAINWISWTNPLFIIKMFNPFKGEKIKEKILLTYNLVKIIFIFCLRAFALSHRKFLEKGRQKKIYKYLFYINYIGYIFSAPFDNYFQSKASKEWHNHKWEKEWSEMYLYFER